MRDPPFLAGYPAMAGRPPFAKRLPSSPTSADLSSYAPIVKKLPVRCPRGTLFFYCSFLRSIIQQVRN